MFAQRKLYMTEMGVCFACSHGSCLETIYDSEYIQKARLEAMWLFEITQPPPDTRTRKEIGIHHCLSRFATRDLTFPCDRLDAILAIFEAYEKMPNPTYNVKSVL